MNQCNAAILCSTKALSYLGCQCNITQMIQTIPAATLPEVGTSSFSDTHHQLYHTINAVLMLLTILLYQAWISHLTEEDQHQNQGLPCSSFSIGVCISSKHSVLRNKSRCMAWGRQATGKRQKTRKFKADSDRPMSHT